jgi:hypothetical protein
MRSDVVLDAGWTRLGRGVGLALAVALGRNIAVYVLGQGSALMLFFLFLLSEICAELGRTKNACLWDFLSRGLGWYLGVDVRGCGYVWVSEGEIPRMGSPWAWGKIGECVGVRVGCRERKTASELCAVVRGGGRTRRRLLSLQKGESIYLARSLGGFVVLVQAQGLFFFIPFLARLARLAQFFFFWWGDMESGEYSRSWMPRPSPHAVTS